jgi:metal-responsive CopG/Arc/MetJ family transcriptional regulator
MAAANLRIQVTVDDELADALTRVDPAPSSRSRLVRDLALRGARAVEDERARADEALTVLLEIADGTRDYDLGAAADVVSRRGHRLQ